MGRVSQQDRQAFARVIEHPGVHRAFRAVASRLMVRAALAGFAAGAVAGVLVTLAVTR